jgi:hypothetical protein
MAQSVYPVPSAGGSAQFAGAGSLAVGAYTSTGSYSTTLAAGRYIVTVQAPQANQAYPQYYQTNALPSYSVTAYNSNAYTREVPLGQPHLLILTTSETVYFAVSANAPRPWHYSCGNMNYEGDRSRIGWSGSNSNFDKFFATGHDSYNQGNIHRLGWFPPSKDGDGDYELSAIRINVFNDRNNYAGRWWNQKAYVGNKYYASRGRNSYNSSFVHWYSTDAITWTSLSYGGVGDDNEINDWVYASTQPTYKYAVIGRSTGASNMLAVSTDGLTWTTRNPGTSAIGVLYGLAHGNNVFVSVGQGGACSSSTDGVTWVSRTMPTTSVNYYNVLHNGTVFLAIGDSNGVGYTSMALSTNGTTWTATSAFPNKAAKDAFTADPALAKGYGITMGYEHYYCWAKNGIFYLYRSGHIWQSSDGISWSFYYVGPGVERYSVIIGWSDTYNKIIGYGYDGTNAYVCLDFSLPATYSIYNSAI